MKDQNWISPAQLRQTMMIKNRPTEAVLYEQESDPQALKELVDQWLTTNNQNLNRKDLYFDRV